MTNAQIWLNENFPLNQRNNIYELCILPSSLENEPSHKAHYQNFLNKFYIHEADKLSEVLDLSTFPRLEKLIVLQQSITRLNVSRCYQLEAIVAMDNLLEKIDWPQWMSNQIPPIKNIYLTNNNFSRCNLSEFSSFYRLESLHLGTDDLERIRQNIYNRWNGSLQHLQNLDDLEELDINSTDINDGWYYLPTDQMFHLTFGNSGRTGAGVDRLRAILIQDLEIEFEEDYTAEQWATSEEVDECWSKVEYVHHWQKVNGRQRPQQQTQIQVNNLQVTFPRNNN